MSFSILGADYDQNDGLKHTSFIKSEELKILLNEIYNADDSGWIELYNPNSIQIDVSGWILKFYKLECFIMIPEKTVIMPDGYLIVCENYEKFNDTWAVPDEVPIVESHCFDPTERTILRLYRPVDGDYFYEMVDEINYTDAPPLPQGHSWARYRGGYDTDNFANDFYDEPYPTPGYDNHRAKERYVTLYTDKSRYLEGEEMHVDVCVGTSITQWTVAEEKVIVTLHHPAGAVETEKTVNFSLNPGEEMSVASVRFIANFTGIAKIEAVLMDGNSTHTYAIWVRVISPPSPPRNLTAEVHDGAVLLRWEQPVESGTPPFTAYRIYRKFERSGIHPPGGGERVHSRLPG